MNALIADFIPTISIIVTILLVGLALGSLVYRGQARLEGRLVSVENRVVAVEKETARIGGLLEGLGLTGRAKAPDAD